MKYAPHFFTLLCAVFSYSTVFSQEVKDGFIIEPDGNYKYGKIKVDNTISRYTFCEFKESSSAEFATYAPHSVQGYGIINESLFLARTILIDDESEKIFLKNEVDGAIKLFYYRHRYFIERDTLIELQDYEEDTDYRKVLANVLQDCRNIGSAVKRTKLSIISLKTLLIKYRRCANNNYKMAIPLTIHVEALGGIESNKTSLSSDLPAFKSFNSGKLIDKTLMSTGVNVNLSFSDLKKVSISTGVYFYQQEFYAIKRSQPTNFTFTDKVNLDFREITVPINLQYSISNKLKYFEPYVKVGISIPFVLESNFKWDHEKEDSNSVYYEDYNSSESFTQSVQLNLSAGVYINVLKKMRTVVEISYQEMNGEISTDEGSISVKGNRINILLGLRF